MDHSRQQPFQTTKFVLWVALIAALAGWGLYVYLVHSVSAIAKDTVALTSESEKLEAEQSRELELKRDLANNQARQPVLTSYFIDATDPVPLFETIEGYGRDTGVAVTINSVDIKKSPSRLMVSVTGTGDFSDVYRFIALLEGAPYEFSVSSASVRTSSAQSAAAAKPGAKPEASVWEAHITLAIASVTGIAGGSTTQK